MLICLVDIIPTARMPRIYNQINYEWRSAGAPFIWIGDKTDWDSGAGLHAYSDSG